MEEIKNIQYGETTQKYDYDISDSATITLLNKIKEEAATREDEDNKLLEKINQADLKYYYPDEQTTATGIVSTSELSFVVTVDNNGNKKVRLHVYNLPNIELLVNIAPHSVDKQTTANPSFTIKVNNLTEDPKGVISPTYHWYVNDVLQELITDGFVLFEQCKDVHDRTNVRHEVSCGQPNGLQYVTILRRTSDAFLIRRFFHSSLRHQ
jgi:hypothetical protein